MVWGIPGTGWIDKGVNTIGGAIGLGGGGGGPSCTPPPDYTWNISPATKAGTADNFIQYIPAGKKSSDIPEFKIPNAILTAIDGSENVRAKVAQWSDEIPDSSCIDPDIDPDTIVATAIARSIIPPNTAMLYSNKLGQCCDGSGKNKHSYITAEQNIKDTPFFLTGDNQSWGDPCPESSSNYITKDNNGNYKLQCKYPDLSSSKLVAFDRNRRLNRHDNQSVPGQVYYKLVKQYCDASLDNIFQVVGERDVKCADMYPEKRDEFCGTLDYIKQGDSCNPETLGESHYNTLAGDYCDDHPSDKWCGCYNNVSGKCVDNPEAAGCAETKEILDSFPPELRTNYSANQRMCLSPSCTNTSAGTFIPASENACNLKSIVCGNTIDVGGSVVGSRLNVNIDCGFDSEGNEEKHEERNTTPPPPPPDRPFYKTSDNFDVKNTDTWTDDDKKIVGGGGLTAVTSCASSALLLIMLL